ncbi:MAG: glycosyltransferase family 2 protein [Caulobacter sp.]|nr:glycosyltransferase family 2 protein [Caulobacter sp.]
MTPTISLIVPTQRRPAGLETALRSLVAQSGVDPARLELIVADNDAVPSARAFVEALEAPFPVRYVHEPRPGVANVRNAALAVACGEIIAFLDDDEEAPASWLAELLAARQALDVDVVFGPVRGRAPQGVRHRAYLEDFFSRHGPDQTQVLDSWYGCGNSLIRRAALPHPTAPFDPSRNASGGEDDLLFARMAAAGARFGWSRAAFVWEDPVPSRLTLAYALRRAFAYGQGPSEHCAEHRDIPGILRWMIAGLVQTALWIPVVAIKWALFAPDRAMPLDRLMRGLGKTFWFPPFSQTFYGKAA